MTDIKLIHKDTDISSLQMWEMPWDVEVNDRPYRVVKISGYVHTIGGQHVENDLWMHPRDEEPTYENLVEYNGRGTGVCWGIRYAPYNYIKTKWDETECFTTGGAMITRNGGDFFFCRGGIDEARFRLNVIMEHPLPLNEYAYAEKILGRKVWWRSQPAVITGWVGNGQACVILEPDGIDKFTTPPEFAADCDARDDLDSIKADIFNKHIWWFREKGTR